MSETQTSRSNAVRHAGWPALLPAHRSGGGDQPIGDAMMLAELPLGPDQMLTIVRDDRGRIYPVPIVTPTNGEARRALPGEGAAEALMTLLSQGDDHGDFRVLRWHGHGVSGERAISVDQTNESVIVGDAVVVKWSVSTDDGPHPAPSLLAALESAGFTGMPRPWGAVEWRGRLVALAVEYVPDAVDGWTWAVEEVRDSVTSNDVTSICAAGTAVGDLVASFHRALATTGRVATHDEMTNWRADATADLERALNVTEGAARELLVDHDAPLRGILDTPLTDDCPVQRVHGDLHVGQVLRSGANSYVLTDFDGNPVLSARERLHHQSPMVDVAGMVQSFVHSGLVVRHHHPDLDAKAIDRAATAAASSFLMAYRTGTEGWDFFDKRLFTSCRARQICREFTYAATHLPRWSYVPEAALPMLISEDDHES